MERPEELKKIEDRIEYLRMKLSSLERQSKSTYDDQQLMILAEETNNCKYELRNMFNERFKYCYRTRLPYIE